jgi:hypothetical protein
MGKRGKGKMEERSNIIITSFVEGLSFIPSERAVREKQIQGGGNPLYTLHLDVRGRAEC